MVVLAAEEEIDAVVVAVVVDAAETDAVAVDSVINISSLKQFECQRCNECCRQPGFVYLESGEAEEISGFLNLDVYRFSDEFCDLQDRRKLVLRKNSDESCIFLTSEGCSIHPKKPKQCRDFPVTWRTAKSLDYCAGLKLLGISETIQS